MKAWLSDVDEVFGLRHLDELALAGPVRVTRARHHRHAAVAPAQASARKTLADHRRVGVRVAAQQGVAHHRFHVGAERAEGLYGPFSPNPGIA